jgi:Fe-Mn family superoxide dismutase
MDVETPELPYSFSDLEPAMSRDTLVFHVLRHQRVCFGRLLAMQRGTELEKLSLEELIRVTACNPTQLALFRIAAEVWNHNVFWRSMRPRGGGAPYGLIGEQLRARFGSHERFVRELKEAATTHFGSGWLWLVWRDGAPAIVTTANAGTPLVRGDPVLLALDLWEHAYYLDHQNRRGVYVSTFLDELVNWDFANRTLAEVLEAKRVGQGAAAPAAPAPELTDCWPPAPGAGDRAALQAPRPP